MADRPGDEELAKWKRWFAVECNNEAWGLAEAPDLDARRSERMLDAAHAAAYFWSDVGDDLNAARADMLLGHAHARAGDGELALRYAERSYDYFARRETADWEIAFANAVLAGAAAAAGRGDLHASRYEEARRLGEAIADAEDRDIYLATFRQVPVPGARVDKVTARPGE